MAKIWKNSENTAGEGHEEDDDGEIGEVLHGPVRQRGGMLKAR
jgi:hypothetical protein